MSNMYLSSKMKESRGKTYRGVGNFRLKFNHHGDPQIIWEPCCNVCTSCGDMVEYALAGASDYFGIQNSRETPMRSMNLLAQHTLDGELNEHRAKRLTVCVLSACSSNFPIAQLLRR